MQDRTTLIKRAALVSLAGNAILATGKLIAGGLTGSLAVLGDGMDSSTDVLVSLVAFITAGIINKPSDREHPYGHSRAEASGTTLLSFVIFFAGAQLAISAGSSLFTGQQRPLPSLLAVVVTLVSIAGKLALAWSQFVIGRKTGSSLLLANGRNMRNDVLISASVLFGLLAARLLRQPMLDPVLALAVGLWVIKSAVGVFREANEEMLDGKADPEVYRAVFEAVRQTAGAENPHRVRVRRLSSLYDIDLDIEVDGSMSVAAAHEVSQKLEQSIKGAVDNIYDIVVHIEPRGAGLHNEQFGLDESSFGEEAKPHGT